MSHLFHFDKDELFKEFVSQYDKKYKSANEWSMRRNIFVENLSKINAHSNPFFFFEHNVNENLIFFSI